jgi:hypothetical protein
MHTVEHPNRQVQRLCRQSHRLDTVELCLRVHNATVGTTLRTAMSRCSISGIGIA